MLELEIMYLHPKVNKNNCTCEMAIHCFHNQKERQSF